ncbi:MAG: type II secretion system protein N, partial [Gammaproteobacteria bacterium]
NFNFTEQINFADLNNVIQNKYLHGSLIVILLFLMTWQVWSTVRFLQTVPSAQVMSTRTAASAEVTAPVVDISTMNLFGISADSAELAPETRLGLQLKSILLMGTSAASSVLITISDDTRAYTVGDVLAGNAVIEEILSDRIIIRYNGRLEVLSLQRQYPDLNQRFSE